MTVGSTHELQALKLLYVARHFPPAVSGGAKRPFLFARELAARGYDVRIIAPAALPGFSVFVVPHPHCDPSTDPPSEGRSLRSWLRDWLLPDPDIRWALRAARAVGSFQPDWVITTSPPESSHVTGWLLKRRYGCKWLADFRDHWFEPALYPARRQRPFRTRIERQLARRMLRSADAFSSTTSLIAGEISKLVPNTAITVFENVADPVAAPAQFEEGLTHIVHTGSFGLSDPTRKLAPILGGFAAAQNPDLRLHLVGRLRADELALIAGSPVSQQIQLHGVVDYDTSRSLQAAADILLLVTSPNTPHVPGKLSEYRAADRPILAIGGGQWQEIAGLQAQSDAHSAFRDLSGNLQTATSSGTDLKQSVASLELILTS